MKKFSILLVAVMLLGLLAFPASAADAFTIQGANTAPVIDGILDDSYVKLHDFYTGANFKTTADEDMTIKGSAYSTYDKDNLYILLAVGTPVNEAFAEYALDMGIFVCGYIAVLATEPGGGWTDDNRFEIGIALTNDGEQIWKVCSPADIKDSSNEQITWPECPFTGYTLRDEAAKYNYYEFSVPWTFLDRTETMSFTEGSKITLNYAANLHSRDDYESGLAHYIEYGGGIWSGGYEDGGVITLGAYPEVVEIEEKTEEIAPVTENVEAAPVVIAAQTNDTGIVWVIVIAIISLAGIFVKKKVRY